MNVAWALFWGGSWWSTKPCFFPCKVAAAGDERYLVCAAVAAAVVSCANWFLLCVLQRVVGASNFSLQNSLKKSASKSFFFRFGVEIHPVLELQFPTPLRVVLLCFAIQCLQTHCSGCVKVACCRGCMRNTIVLCSWIS